VRGTDRELEIEVEHINSLIGQTVTFTLSGATVGTAVVNSLGQAELELETEDGDTVPVVSPGALVTVLTSNGTLIVSGNFP
jgi:hypothetical protein